MSVIDLNLEPESEYLKIIEEVFPGSTKRKMDLNFIARKEADFSCNELKFYQKKMDVIILKIDRKYSF